MLCRISAFRNFSKHYFLNHKNAVFAVTVCHHSASLVVPNGDLWDEFSIVRNWPYVNFAFGKRNLSVPILLMGVKLTKWEIQQRLIRVTNKGPWIAHLNPCYKERMLTTKYKSNFSNLGITQIITKAYQLIKSHYLRASKSVGNRKNRFSWNFAHF